MGPGKALLPDAVSKAVDAIQTKRAEKGVTLSELSKLTGRSPVYIAAALRGQSRLHPEAAQKVAKVLGLDEEMTSVLTACPVRNQFPCTTDPLKYRFLEVIGVYGDAIRDACNELFGDGIMSAITFKLSIDKEVVEGTEYVVITMKGKWLPYKEF
ncbi:MAG: cyanase [Planctomycetes bacterium RIFCSPLOWO2_12_38_17]|nr:MAG: cyanase [Planctomycetes bacterium RIFCSPLOWO2_12_38_17]